MPLLLAALVLLAVWWGGGQASEPDVRIGARLFAPGESFDGQPLAADHPLLRARAQAVLAAAQQGATALSLRRFCAWGRPGRTPLRSTLADVLRHAQVPEPVRLQVGAAHAAAWAHDRLVVTREAIRSTTGPRVFTPELVALAYGEALCLGARVNFPAGEAIEARLYEAFDDHGRRYSVMVTEGLGHVALLREAGEPAPPRRAGAALARATPAAKSPAAPSPTAKVAGAKSAGARHPAKTSGASGAGGAGSATGTSGTDHADHAYPGNRPEERDREDGGAGNRWPLRLAAVDPLDPGAPAAGPSTGAPPAAGARAPWLEAGEGATLATVAPAGKLGPEVHEVPAPGTLVLSLTALVALLGFTRRRRRPAPARAGAEPPAG